MIFSLIGLFHISLLSVVLSSYMSNSSYNCFISCTIFLVMCPFLLFHLWLNIVSVNDLLSLMFNFVFVIVKISYPYSIKWSINVSNINFLSIFGTEKLTPIPQNSTEVSKYFKNLPSFKNSEITHVTGYQNRVYCHLSCESESQANETIKAVKINKSQQKDFPRKMSVKVAGAASCLHLTNNGIIRLI